ncbi:MAG: alkyl hydroperoxide reductase/Thiol specific antioxidant/Mal allergen [Gemmatimonadetes bacterium]|nr:alkyl hydroperoxide reductase/Thiol specific antioxidant/Mal allergen [Gemmatimonadota bacterium]
MRELKERYPDEVEVVGVHSGKFTGERDSAHIRDASIRLGAVHPTLNDRQFRVWRSYAVNAWPTLVAVDPRGYVIGVRAGEYVAAELFPFIDRVLGEARTAGTLRSGRMHFAPDPSTVEQTDLAFPGKIAVDGRRIAVADSGHHRILVGTLDEAGTRMQVDRALGGDAPGYRDGSSPRFTNPQGLAFSGDTLFIADAGNHSIRAASIDTGEVRTIAGIGRQAHTMEDLDAGAMSSPWDLALDDRTLFVAMAGLHQIVAVDLATSLAVVHSGSGAEELHDGKHAEAALAQPMGICLAGDVLCFTDSESSAVRTADRDPAGRVRTIVGTDLFDFGDADGTGDDVRLQHPQGIAMASDGRLLVADSYNGALKWIDRLRKTSETWLRGFSESSGLTITEELVYVADTNRHRIAVVDRRTGSIGDLPLDFERQLP